MIYVYLYLYQETLLSENLLYLFIYLYIWLWLHPYGTSHDSPSISVWTFAGCYTTNENSEDSIACACPCWNHTLVCPITIQYVIFFERSQSVHRSKTYKGFPKRINSNVNEKEIALEKTLSYRVLLTIDQAK